jgi:lipopolysaccharide/colanic/teichoic acid biosynthesis glycosyltransferase
MNRYLELVMPVDRLPEISESRRIHPSKTFTTILTRERDRADRTGLEFCLVAFEPGTNNGRSAATRYLVSLVTNRIRTTDDAGWLDDGRIGVVLSHTSTDGAWKFADNIHKEFDEEFPRPACTVYAYPSSWLSDTDGDFHRASQSGNPPFDSRRKKEFPRAVSTTARKEHAKPLDSVILGGIPAWKRVIDIAGSIVALILLSPLLLAVAIMIKIVSPGPLFFRQERVGLLGKTFILWKFRTMRVNADTGVHQKYLQELINNEKTMTKLDNKKDPRIIPFGTILRKAGIDELPQLINVLRGEMSLVGPRPCLPYEAREYQNWQTRRFDTIPGLTGLWQVSGKNNTTFKEMIRLDIAYAKKRAFWLDVKIFLKTIPAIVAQVTDKPAYAFSKSRAYSVLTRVVAPVFALLSLLTYDRFHK